MLALLIVLAVVYFLYKVFVARSLRLKALQIARARPFERDMFALGYSVYESLEDWQKQYMLNKGAEMGLDLTDPDDIQVFIHELGFIEAGRQWEGFDHAPDWIKRL